MSMLLYYEWMSVNDIHGTKSVIVKKFQVIFIFSSFVVDLDQKHTALSSLVLGLLH